MGYADDRRDRRKKFGKKAVRGADPSRKGPDYAVGPVEEAKILAIIALGGSLRDAAAFTRINRKTLYNHQKRDPNFAASIHEAEAMGKVYLLKKIRRGTQKDWRAAAWMLERKHSKEFGLLTGLAEANIDKFKRVVVSVLNKHGQASLAEQVCRALDKSGDVGDDGGDEVVLSVDDEEIDVD